MMKNGDLNSKKLRPSENLKQFSDSIVTFCLVDKWVEDVVHLQDNMKGDINCL